MAVVEFHEFSSREKLASALAERLVDLLAQDAHAGEPASVAFSGGSTPKQMLQEFSAHGVRLDWDRTTVTLVDERRVAPTSDRSNEKFLRENLFDRIDDAGLMKNCFVPLSYGNSTGIEDCIASEKKLTDAIDASDLTAVVLGMGTDGHTASWFPGGDNLAAATNPDAKPMFMPMNAPGAGEERITMTASRVAAARHVILHIEGMEKREVFEQAKGGGPAHDLPIRHVLRNPNIKLDVYWSA